MSHTFTITEAHEKLRAKKVSATDLVKSCIERIESVDKTLNAVVYRNFDSALIEAKKIDSKGEWNSPLSGIPFLAKDVFCEKNVQTTACSNVLRHKNYVPAFESTTTARLKNAGAISIGKTNTDEFTMGGSTETSCYGTTRNPWNPKHTAGGSSGGSASAVAADEAVFALGTDTGGSIRQPASYCNVCGLRPTYGRTSRYGAMSMASSLDTTGPICKSVEDAAIILQAIAGKDPLDGTTGDKPVPDYRAALKNGVKGMRVGIPKEYFVDGMNAEVEAATREAAKVLKGLGAELKDISLPHTKYALATYYVLCPCEVSSNMARYDGIRFGHTVEKPDGLLDYYERVRSEGYGTEVKRRIMIGTYALSAGYYDAYYRQALKVRTLICQDFENAYKDVDVILTPVAPTPAFEVGVHANDPVAMYLEDAFMDAAVMAGIPAISIPGGFSKTNLPIGIQMMCPQWEEARLLQAAYAYEQATDWHKQKPKIS